MVDVDGQTPDPDLADLLHLWRVDPRGHGDELKAAFPDDVRGDESFAALDRIVSDAEDRLGVERLTGVFAQDAAVAAMCRRVVEERLSPRELTYWVTRVVGWRGSVRTQPLLDLEQEYCGRPLSDDELDALDARVRTAAEVFLSTADGAGDSGDVRPRLQRVRRLLRRSR